MSSTVPRTAEDFKAEGKKYYGATSYEEAIKSYESGLKIAKDAETIKSLRLNLAASHLAVEGFEDAIKYCKSVLEKDPTNETAIRRAAKAAYELRDYKEVRRLVDAVPRTTDEEIQSLRQRCDERIVEQEKGVDVEKLHESVCSRSHIGESPFPYALARCNPTASTTTLPPRRLPVKKLDVADYQSPKIVRQLVILGKNHSAYRGYGVIAKEDISVGTILAVGKAWAVESPTDNELQNCDVKNRLENVRRRLRAAIKNKVFRNPRTLRRFFYSLLIDQRGVPFDHGLPAGSAGPDLSDMAIAFRGIPKMLREALQPGAVRSYECEGPESLIEPYFFEMDSKGTVGLFGFPSFFNCSHVANAHYNFWGDVIVVHAIKPIAEGEQVTIFFDDPREQNLLEGACDCELCTAADADPARRSAATAKLIADCEELMRELMMNPPLLPFCPCFENVGMIQGVSSVDDMIARVEMAYDQAKVPAWARLPLFQVYLQRMDFLDSDAIAARRKSLIKVLAALGMNYKKLVALADEGCDAARFDRYSHPNAVWLNLALELNDIVPPELEQLAGQNHRAMEGVVRQMMRLERGCPDCWFNGLHRFPGGKGCRDKPGGTSGTGVCCAEWQCQLSRP